jgi:hypothetical protein
MAVRDTVRGEQVAAGIRKASPAAKVTVMCCDLMSLASIKARAPPAATRGLQQASLAQRRCADS